MNALPIKAIITKPTANGGTVRFSLAN